VSVEPFFEVGKTYRHYWPDSTPSPEGWFLVKLVDKAPPEFEHHRETLGVAFGWRRGLSPNGVIEGLGSYVTPDFAGWAEVPNPGLSL